MLFDLLTLGFNLHHMRDSKVQDPQTVGKKITIHRHSRLTPEIPERVVEDKLF